MPPGNQNQSGEISTPSQIGSITEKPSNLTKTPMYDLEELNKILSSIKVLNGMPSSNSDSNGTATDKIPSGPPLFQAAAVTPEN